MNDADTTENDGAPAGAGERVLMKLLLHTIEVGDVLTMVGPDGLASDVFTLAELPGLRRDAVWIYREYDTPIVVDRTYGLESSFVLHNRRAAAEDRYRTLP